ncbi:tRNA-dependent cyclodipeptide synthase [Jatrophihabitans lederbergiae]|uniref:Cyclodipeptide synthase n=1 Tax=Jatrophihabitans lederbergiae TaxID=3075547 RepID=A0ABU2JG56_9ACTN|nr:tRNA-dependent cyclodipeptide synthase [Jatrophihabitans sp. DSM 44399]MDT0263917.1 tRNA-dependent cyclodipeptide synthase [Jatrophihabitans sp. DSM 44399]
MSSTRAATSGMVACDVVGTVRTYKTKIASVAPTGMREHYATLGSGFLGVSLENDEFGPAKLQSMIRWLDRKFTRTAVLIGDSIHRITLETVRGLPEPQALNTAMRMGDDVVATIDGMSAAGDTPILRCSEIQTRPDYARAFQQLTQLFDADDAFRRSVLGFSERFQRRNGVPGDAANLDWKVRRSCEYFLEEFAVFACLVSDGFRVMAYPGAFSTLTEIAHGEHGGVPSDLKDLVVVSLDLKGTGS